MQGLRRVSLLIGTLALSALLTVLSPVVATAQPRGIVKVGIIDFGRELLGPGRIMLGGRSYGEAMYDPLMGVNADGSFNFENGLLRSLETTDGQVYTLTLKEGIKFHNGAEMTSEDVKWTIEYSVGNREIGNISTIYFRASLDRIEIVNRYALKIHLKGQDVQLPSVIAPVEGDLFIFPKDYFLSVGERGFEAKPVGSGPFKFVERKLGEYVEYEANESYFNPKGVPGFKRLRLELVPDAASRRAKLRTGEIDLILVDPKDVTQLSQQGFKVVGPKYTSYPMVNFLNSWDPAFLTNKLEFRKALVLAVDMKAIVRAFYPPGTAEQAVGSPAFSPINLGYDPDLPAYPFDPNESRRLLREIGYNGTEVTFYNSAFPGTPEMPEVNVAIANYLRQVGINVKLVDIDWTTLNWLSRTYSPPAVILQSGTQPRPSVLGNVRVYLLGKKDGGAVAGHSDSPKILEAYNRIKQIVDVGERAKALRVLAKSLYDDYWCMPIVWRHGPWVAGNRIAEWTPVSGTSDFLRFETLKPSAQVTP